MQAFMKYDQGSGVKAGGSDSLSEGGAYIFEITSAIYSCASTGTHGIEFSVQTKDGLKGRYINIYYAKKDNTPVSGGQSILNAIMGLLKIPAISFLQSNRDGAQVNCVPEIEGKTIGLFLQKKLYTKNDGSDGYQFEMKTPFDPATGKTLRELVNDIPANTIDRMTAAYKDSDERKAPQGNGGYPPSGPDVGDTNSYGF